MSDELASDPRDDVAALVAVTRCDVQPDVSLGVLAQLAEAAVDALGGTAGGLWTLDDRLGDRRLVAAVRMPTTEAALALPQEAVARLGEGSGRVDLAPEEIPEPLRRVGVVTATAVPVPTGGSIAGALVIGSTGALAGGSLRDHAVEAAAGRIGVTLDGIRLRENLERAMAQILETDERMLGRIGLDIHDGPTQQLSVAMLEVQLLEAELEDGAAKGHEVPAAVRSGLERIHETLGGALHEMRELIGHLRPAQFDDRRLSDILQDAITGFEQRSDCVVTARFEGEFPENGVSITQRITFYRILQEALTNAYRHGAARRVEVTAREGPAGVTLEVRDDGIGFDPEDMARRAPGMPLARFGLHGMRDRAQVLGGTFSVWSRPGDGAVVRVFLPRWRPPVKADLPRAPAPTAAEAG